MSHSTPGEPPVRADHVGSLLRPRSLRDAFRAHSRNELSDAELRRARHSLTLSIPLLVFEDSNCRSTTTPASVCHKPASPWKQPKLCNCTLPARIDGNFDSLSTLVACCKSET